MLALFVVAWAWGVVVGAAFVAVYARRHWNTRMGRNLMGFPALIALGLVAFILLAVGVKLPLWLWLAGFVALDVLMTQRLWLLLKTS